MEIWDFASFERKELNLEIPSLHIKGSLVRRRRPQSGCVLFIYLFVKLCHCQTGMVYLKVLTILGAFVFGRCVRQVMKQCGENDNLVIIKRPYFFELFLNEYLVNFLEIRTDLASHYLGICRRH